ncbi:leucyl/phenylalanyl-tRNA--protein transferase [Thaumasiovibrio subtropicus]|uniref:leucyl/phenylalanyl-tRNA--protein transferase n=1 Tax=Thaumasiovibrio subtropicus TaxID=1891207 RepID=UPI000B35F44E|nr:leucyl/phenylalanyl-tRNA--protein transferase [Thaumasiovibrio subtropicus]
MTIYLPQLSHQANDFPSPYEALEEPNGLLAYGGDLSQSRLLEAYRHGIFPWYSIGEPILWWSPAPRAIFIPEQLTPSKSTRKYQRKHQYQVTLNHAFDEVIDLCASTRGPEQTWITLEMRQAYKQLHKAGTAHSVEVWSDNQLIGGLYGLSIGRIFCGESMFSLKSNASKIALWYFCHHFERHNGKLIDCQVMNDHLSSLGAVEMPRQPFLAALEMLRDKTLADGCFNKQEITL